ncbi:MAG TPA: MEDS domain-containing protein [Gemmatimonadaceae bacterium]|nr:MEDS domain-containing protein [Gemmatimonadaceae bacterium]
MGGRESHRETPGAVPAGVPTSEHLLQIYDSERVFLDTLEGFVSGGLRAGEGIIVIATDAHIEGLESRLLASGLDLEAMRYAGQYTSLNAEEVLSQFIVDRWPDKDLFQRTMTGLLARAGASGRKIRVFGEMVAVLWQRGEHGATVRLEYLWHQLTTSVGFSLLCAYPKSAFVGETAKAISELTALHSGVLSASAPSRKSVNGGGEVGGDSPPEAPRQDGRE